MHVFCLHACIHAHVCILTLQKSAGTAATFAVQPPSSSSPATFVVQPPSSSSPASVPQPSPAAVLSPTISNAVVSNTSSTVATSTQKPDLLGGLEGDPFHTSESHAVLNNAHT